MLSCLTGNLFHDRFFIIRSCSVELRGKGSKYITFKLTRSIKLFVLQKWMKYRCLKMQQNVWGSGSCAVVLLSFTRFSKEVFFRGFYPQALSYFLKTHRDIANVWLDPHWFQCGSRSRSSTFFQCGSGSRVLMTKNLKTFTAGNFLKFFDQKLPFTYSKASIKKDVQVTGEVFISSKENIQNFNTWNFFTVLPSWIRFQQTKTSADPVGIRFTTPAKYCMSNNGALISAARCWHCCWKVKKRFRRRRTGSKLCVIWTIETGINNISGHIFWRWPFFKYVDIGRM